MTEPKLKKSLKEQLKSPYNLYQTITSILIGVGVGLVIIIIVGFATRDSRPTQYTLLLIRNAIGIDLTNAKP